MLPTLQIGPLAVPLAPLALLVGIWLGLSLSERLAWQFGVNKDQLTTIVLIAIIAGLIGARLTYVLQFPAAFRDNLLATLQPTPALLDPWGGALAGFLAAGMYAQRVKLLSWAALDALTPFFAVLSLSLGFSHLFSGSAFGTETDLPWGIELWGARRHPAQVYEILAAVGILILVLKRPLKGLQQENQPGKNFLRFIALSSGARLFLEAFRGDSYLLPSGIRLAQVAAWVVLGISLLWIATRKNFPPKREEGEVTSR
jgi:phosphatidylglycerol:prolipoprotein diacylglycerol transferase